MNDLLFVFFTILIVTVLIYVLYNMMASSEREPNKNAELQITSQGILEQITILKKQKKYNLVESLAEKYLAQKPSDDSVRSLLAKSLFEAKKVHAAIEQTKIVVKHQPLNYGMRIFLANCYLHVDKSTQAIEILQKVLEDDPANTIAMRDLAKAYLDTNQKQSSIKIYKQLEEFVENNQEKSKTKTTIAEIYVSLKDFNPAIKEYKEVLGIYPEDINSKKRLIELYKLTSNYDALIDLGNELLQSADSANALWTMTMIMDAYKEKRDYEKAMEFANLIKMHPLADEIVAKENIAKILFEEGNVSNSITLLKSLLEKDPNNVGINKYLAKAYEENKNFDLATGIYKKVLDIVPAKEIHNIQFELSNIYSNWAMYLFEQKNNDECFKHFIIALKYDSNNPDIYYRLGLVNQLIKNYNEAIVQYKKAIELDGANPQYYYAVAECYEEIDSIYDQKKALIECLKYSRTNSKIYYKLGIIYNIQNDTNNAISHMQQSVDLDNDFIDAKYRLALMLEHVGRLEEATDLYEQILLVEPDNEEVAINLKMLKS